MSLWRKICFSAVRLAHALDHRIVVEASDRIRQFGISLAMVEMPVSFET